MAAKHPKNSAMQISHYLDPKLVLFLEDDTKESVIASLVELLAKEGKLIDKKLFEEAILERERVVSTGIGLGLALPHAKLAQLKDFFIAIGVHRRGIGWDSIDAMPVRLIFMIGGPDSRPTEYLQLLSKLTAAMREEERRKKILQLQDREEIISAFTGI